MNKPIIIIPAYQPDQELSTLVKELTCDPEQKIIVVDDGSTGASRDIIDSIEKNNNQVEVLRHAINLGKGQALKTGFNHFLVKYAKDFIGVITVDADGQHNVKDVIKVSKGLQDHPDALILGSRKLEHNVPLKRLLGNKLTILVFTMVTGVTLIDAQTGLRGIPTNFLFDLLHSSESGYDFELDMLIRAAKGKYNFYEIPIQTIYMAQNKGSHFNYFRDSVKIYFVFLRFSLLSLATATIDYLVFSLSLFYFTNNILLSIVIARLIAGTFQFVLGKLWVFKSQNKIMGEVFKYVLLVTVLMMLSYGLITPMVIYLKFSPYLAKLIAEGSIFFLSFTAQNLFVYSYGLRGDKTNWDRYYNSTTKISSVSRKFTENKLINLINQYGTTPIQSICELGGGNSCFFPRFSENYPEAIYTIIDNNQRGLDIFLEHYNDPKIRIINDDIINPKIRIDPVDLVFSVGLIEHFSKENTAKAIQEHFNKGKPGSLVIITFPTPTWLYVTARFLVESFGAWKFPDERPLSIDEVAGLVNDYGEIINTSINWPIIFTQGIIVAQVNNSELQLSRSDFIRTETQ